MLKIWAQQPHEWLTVMCLLLGRVSAYSPIPGILAQNLTHGQTMSYAYTTQRSKFNTNAPV
jgi:hypothetical protein